MRRTVQVKQPKLYQNESFGNQKGRVGVNGYIVRDAYTPHRIIAKGNVSNANGLPKSIIFGNGSQAVRMQCLAHVLRSRFLARTLLADRKFIDHVR